MDRDAPIHFAISMTTRVLGRAHLWATRNTEQVPQDITEFIQSPDGLGPGAVGVLLLRPVRPEPHLSRTTIREITVALTPARKDALDELKNWCRTTREASTPRWSGALMQGRGKMRFVSRAAVDGGKNDFTLVGDTPADWRASILGKRAAARGIRVGVDGLHTEASWEIFTDDANGHFALVVRSGEAGPTLAVLILKVGRVVGSRELTAEDRRRIALENLAAASWEMARVLSQKYWLWWTVAAEKTLADLHRLAPIQQDKDACRHHEIFPQISKVIADVVKEVATMVQSPAVAVFTPDTNGRLGVLAGVGYKPDLPGSCDDQYVGITWLFSNVATIASRFQERSADHAFQVIGDARLKRIYEKLDLPVAPREQRVSGNDHHLDSDIAASAWDGPWSWCGFELEPGLFCAEPLSPTATDRVSKYKRDAARNVREAAGRDPSGNRTYDFVPLEKGRASGVLKVQSRRHSTLDLDRHRPSFSHRELRYLQHAAGLIGLVIQRLSRVHLRALSMSVRARVSAALARRGVDGGLAALATQLGARSVLLISAGPPAKVIAAAQTLESAIATALTKDVSELSTSEAQEGADAEIVRALRERPVKVGTAEFNAYRLRVPESDAYLVVVGVRAEMPPLKEPAARSRPNLGFSRFLQHVLDVVGSLFCVALSTPGSRRRSKAHAPTGVAPVAAPGEVPEEFQRLVDEIKRLHARGTRPTGDLLARKLGLNNKMDVTRLARATGQFSGLVSMLDHYAPRR